METPLSDNFAEILRSAGGRELEAGTIADFGDARAEYTAARESSALFPLFGTCIELTGDDRAKFMHNFSTNDINGLNDGRSCEAFLTTVKARVLSHAFLSTSDQSLWLDSLADQEDAIFSHLDRYIITDDVKLACHSNDTAGFYVSGPATVNALKILADREPQIQECFIATIAGEPVRIVRLDLFGVPGVLMRAARSSAETIWQACVKQGMVAAGGSAFEANRIAAGVPLAGVDLTEDHLAPEGGRTAQAISYTKGCYLGQEPIARINAMGHINRTLRSLSIDSEDAGLSADAVCGTEIEFSGKTVGRVSSAAVIPGMPVFALAMLSTSVQAGADLSCQCAGQGMPVHLIG